MARITDLIRPTRVKEGTDYFLPFLLTFQMLKTKSGRTNALPLSYYNSTALFSGVTIELNPVTLKYSSQRFFNASIATVALSA